MRTSVVVGLISVVASMASAQSGCVSIDDDSERLVCYDNAAGREAFIANRAEGLLEENEEANDSPEDMGADQPTARNDWLLSKRTSRMTDETDVFLSVYSDQPVQCRWGDGEVIITVRCHENTTAATIQTPCHVTSSRYNDYGDVTYRVDDREPRVKAFEASTNNRALGLWNYRKARPFINDLMGGNKLIVRFTPFSESRKEVIFDIAGLEEAIKPLREQCGW